MVEKTNFIAESSNSSCWTSIEESNSCPSPVYVINIQRSLHTMVFFGKFIYLFGGYDGSKRTNDFYKYDIYTRVWSKIVTNDMPPSARDRHVAVIHDRSIFIFGGYDGVNRVNDFYEFNTDNNTWQEVIYSGMYSFQIGSGQPPTPRHSHCAIIYDGSIYVFGGYDGSYKSDLHRFNFETNTWKENKKLGSSSLWPRERYRTSACVYNDCMYIYGGHDGSKQLGDFWSFDISRIYLIEEKTCWKLLEIQPNMPSLRDSHVSFVYKDGLYIHGGSSASNIYHKDDFFEFNFIQQKWTSLKYYINDNSSNHVFCHSGVFVDCQKSFYIFGGYNGITRLNDFKFFKFNDDEVAKNSKSQSFVKNMENFINNSKFSDIKIITNEDNLVIHGHKIILARCPYFDNLFASEFKENLENEIKIDNISHSTMTKIVKFIYTNCASFENSETAKIFEAACYFGIEDLKRICEEKIMSGLSIQNACDVLLTADQYNSNNLRDQVVKFFVDNFNEIVMTESFGTLLKNPDLALEIIRTFASKNIKQN